MKRGKAREEARVRKWNEAHDVGIEVVVRKDDGKLCNTTTRSEAQMLGGHTAVIWVQGIPGAYALDRVRPSFLEQNVPSSGV